MTKTRFWILLLLGGFLTLFGGFFIGIYIWEAFILRIGEPDQSLLFWYLPILFIGLFISLIGLLLLAYLIYRVRSVRVRGECWGQSKGTE